MKKAWFYGIPIFYNPKTNEVKGINTFFDLLLGIMIFIHINIIVHITGCYDFPIEMIKGDHYE